jgi:hypothetical protein
VIGRRARLIVLGFVSAVSGAAACRGGGGEAAIASLVETQGVVERADGADWRGASVGDRFMIGGAVRTGGGAGARLRLEAGAVIRMGENALLRFQRGNLPGAAAAEIRVERGAAEIEQGGGSELALVTAAGRTRLERGAHVRIRAQDDGVVLEVLVGRAVLLQPGGELAVEAGSGARLRIGGALIEKFDLKVGAAIVEPLAPKGEPAVAAAVADAGVADAEAAPAATHE